MSRAFQSITPPTCEAADELGYRVKLLGVAVRTETGIEQRVHPTMVPRHLVDRAGDGRHQRRGDRFGDALDRSRSSVPGAGGAATASAVVADIADVASGIRRVRSVRAAGAQTAQDRARADAAARRRLLHPPDGAR
jgi:homoserine dehydrogenase